MRIRILCWTLGLWIVASWAAGPAHARNPKVNLKLDQVTAAEAIKALTKAAGVSIRAPQIEAAKAVQGAVVPAVLQEKHSFDWSAARLGEALRQLCSRYELRLSRDYRTGGYSLYSAPGFAIPAGPPGIGLVEKQGVKLAVSSATSNYYRNVNFAAGGGPQVNGSAQLNLQLAARLRDLDPLKIAGIANVTAKDDTGNVLVSNQRGMISWSGSYGGNFPDEWRGNVSLSNPHPQAKKLTWLEGDLLVYRVVHHVRVELALPPTQKLVKKELGGLLIALSDYRPTGKAPATQDDLGLPGLQPAGAGPPGPSFRLRIVMRAGKSYVDERGNSYMQPRVLDAEGKPIPVGASASSGMSNGQWTLRDARYRLATKKQKPVKLVFDLYERTEPGKLFTFRMQNIPVPGRVPFVARKTVPAPPRAAKKPKGPHPYFQEGGATLAVRVEVGGRPAGRGTLQIGLAPKTATGFGPIRWTDVEVDAQGRATLKNVKPGAYRLLRVYRPANGRLDPLGRWQNAESAVTLAAGKSATAPTLSWTLPAPGAKQ